MPFLRPNKRSWVGLALRQDQISLVKLAYTKNGLIVEDAALTDLPFGLMVEGQVCQADWIVSHVKNLVKTTQSENCYAAISVPSACVINKQIQLPAYLTDQERALEIESNITQYLPGMNEDLHFDYASVGQSGEQEDVLLVAARAAQINRMVTVAQKAGLKIRVADVDVYALARAALFADGVLNKEQVVAVLDIDTVFAQLIMLQQGKIIFVHQLITNAAEGLVSELHRGFKLFFAATQSAEITKVILSGKIGKLDELKQFIENDLKFPVELTNPFRFTALSSKLDKQDLYFKAPSLLTAFGLAIRSYPEW